MEYTVIEETNLGDLIVMVNEHLKNGWVLQGGVSQVVVPETFKSYYTQAMTRQDWAKILSKQLQEEKSDVSER